MQRYGRLKSLCSLAPAVGWWVEDKTRGFDPLVFWGAVTVCLDGMPDEEPNYFKNIIGATASDLFELNEALELTGTMIDPVIFERKFGLRPTSKRSDLG